MGRTKRGKITQGVYGRCSRLFNLELAWTSQRIIVKDNVAKLLLRPGLSQKLGDVC